MRSYLAFAATFVALSLPLQAAQPIQQKLRATVKSYKLSEPTFLDALIKVASDFKIPMGVELVKSPSVLRPVKRTWRKATVMEIFTALVHGEKGYRLRVDDGILHVFQEDIVNRRSNFLNIRIKTFELRNTTAGAADQRLWRLVNAKLYQPARVPGPRGGVGFSLAERTDEPTFSLHLHGATVRGILDRLALSSNDKIWVVAFSPGKAMLPSGFLRTVSPTRTGRTSDEGQPGWESLRWGEKPY